MGFARFSFARSLDADRGLSTNLEPISCLQKESCSGGDGGIRPPRWAGEPVIRVLQTFAPGSRKPDSHNLIGGHPRAD